MCYILYDGNILLVDSIHHGFENAVKEAGYKDSTERDSTDKYPRIDIVSDRLLN